MKLVIHRKKLPQNLRGFPPLVLTITSFLINAVNGLAFNVLDQLVFDLVFKPLHTWAWEDISTLNANIAKSNFIKDIYKPNLCTKKSSFAFCFFQNPNNSFSLHMTCKRIVCTFCQDHMEIGQQKPSSGPQVFMEKVLPTASALRILLWSQLWLCGFRFSHIPGLWFYHQATCSLKASLTFGFYICSCEAA